MHYGVNLGGGDGLVNKLDCTRYRNLEQCKHKLEPKGDRIMHTEGREAVGQKLHHVVTLCIAFNSLTLNYA